jgi:hypothetical protein
VTVLPSDPVLTSMPAAFAETTLRSAGVSPPIVLLLASWSWMPSSVLPSGPPTVPVVSSPTRLPATTFPVAVAPVMKMPSWPLSATRLPAPAVLPPTVLLLAAVIRTPF